MKYFIHSVIFIIKKAINEFIPSLANRFLAVRFPFDKSTFGSARRIKTVCSSVLTISLLKNVEVFWTRGLQIIWDDKLNRTILKTCGNPTPKIAEYNKQVRPYFVFVVAVILPLLIIATCNLLIVWTLKTVK